MKRLYLTGIMLIFTFFYANSQPRILMIGDSTMADYDEEKYSGEKEQRGWGQLLPLFLKDNVILNNEARNGRSSKSFYNERWGELKETIKAGDYVIIQFGHNDEKNDGEDTDENDLEARGTNPWSQYQKYLSIYIDDTRARGGHPILATPVVRRILEDGKVEPKGRHSLTQYCHNSDSLLNYPLAMKKVAEDKKVPLIDMTHLTQKVVENMTTEGAAAIIYINADKTHLKEMGALIYAKLMADALKRDKTMEELLK